MSRTIGTMKVAVFEEQATEDGDRSTMLALANLFGEAANWLRDETCRKVSGKKGDFHRIYNISANVVVSDNPEQCGPVVQFFVHYDDNEKG